MSQSPERITDFRALADIFGVTPPPQSAPPKDHKRHFYTLPPLDKLRICSHDAEKTQNKHERYERKADAVVAALRLSPEERAAQGIRAIALVANDEGGEAESFPGQNTIDVAIVFPANRQGNPRVLAMPDSLLKTFGDVNDAFIREHVDEIREELLIDRQGRLRRNIKALDAAIAEQKKYVSRQKFGRDYAPIQTQVKTRNVTQEMERLNRLKTILTRDFIQASLALEQENPHLQPLFVMHPSRDGGLHVELEMWDADESTLLKRMMDASVAPVVKDGNGMSFSTNVSMQAMEQNYRQFCATPDAALAHVQAGYEIYRVLHDADIRQRKREKKHISTQRKPIEISPELSTFANLSVREQLAQALRDQNAGKDTLSKEKALKEKQIAMRNAIALSPEERKEQHIDVVVLAATDERNKIVLEDPLYSEYRVFVVFGPGKEKKFLAAMRGELAPDPLQKNTEVNQSNLTAFDALLQQQKVIIKPEETSDTYKRRLQELKVLDEALHGLRRGKRGEDAHQARQDFETVKEKKNVLLFSLIELATLMQGETSDRIIEVSSVMSEGGHPIMNFAFSEIQHKYLIPYLIGGLRHRRIDFVSSGQESRIPLSVLRRQKEAFDRGEETEANGAVAAIWDYLEEHNMMPR